ncbi:MAG: NAD(+)/NADH kinase [Terriglobales bacterium]
MPEPTIAGARIAIYAKPGGARESALIRELEAWLRARGYEPVRDAAAQPAPALAVVLGGDGTLLHVARHLAAAATPVLAVHLGTLGFLTATALEDLYPSLETILAGGGVREHRTMLRVRLQRGGREIGVYDVLNEAVVGKAELARMVRFELAIDGQRLGSVRADGVLVATPTGSTAYNLSAGGAVAHPGVAALLLTPICPHACSQRPLLTPAGAEISITLGADATPALLTLDGQQGVPLEPGDRVLCTQGPHALQCASAAPLAFYERLRSKLTAAR